MGARIPGRLNGIFSCGRPLNDPSQRFDVGCTALGIHRMSRPALSASTQKSRRSPKQKPRYESVTTTRQTREKLDGSEAVCWRLREGDSFANVIVTLCNLPCHPAPELCRSVRSSKHEHDVIPLTNREPSGHLHRPRPRSPCIYARRG